MSEKDMAWVGAITLLWEVLDKKAKVARCENPDCNCGGVGKAIATDGPKVIQIGPIAFVYPNTVFLASNGEAVNLFNEVSAVGGNFVPTSEVYEFIEKMNMIRSFLNGDPDMGMNSDPSLN